MEEFRYLSQLMADLFKNPRIRFDGGNTMPLQLPPDGGPTIQLEQSAERAALAVGSLLLLLVEERGGTRLPKAALERVARRALDTFDGGGRARVTDEVTRVCDWLAEALLERGETSEPQSWGDVHYEAAPYLPVIKQAISRGEDLEIEYFSYNRGEWTQRRITPTRLDGRSTVIGHCHLRQTERRFRLSRIRSLQPIGGAAPVVERAPSAPEVPVIGWGGEPRRVR